MFFRCSNIFIPLAGCFGSGGDHLDVGLKILRESLSSGRASRAVEDGGVVHCPIRD